MLKCCAVLYQFWAQLGHVPVPSTMWHTAQGPAEVHLPAAGPVEIHPIPSVLGTAETHQVCFCLPETTEETFGSKFVEKNHYSTSGPDVSEFWCSHCHRFGQSLAMCIFHHP